MIHLYRYGTSNLTTTPRVIQSSYEGPEEFNTTREQFAKISQNNKKKRDTKYRINYGYRSSGRRAWRNVPVTWNKKISQRMSMGRR